MSYGRFAKLSLVLARLDWIFSKSGIDESYFEAKRVIDKSGRGAGKKTKVFGMKK